MTEKQSAGHVSFPLERISGVIPPLQQADIVLIHIKKNLLRYLIRKVTNSYWDHTALILFTKDEKKERFCNLIMEAVWPKGIEIHKLDKYLIQPEKYDIGIKRVPDLTEANRKNVIDFALMNVDALYYRLSLIKFGLAFISKRFKKRFLRRQRYSCTGFVQKAFYEAASIDQRDKFVFRTDFLSPIEMQEITTPADIAHSKNSKWIYNEKNGQVL